MVGIEADSGIPNLSLVEELVTSTGRAWSVGGHGEPVRSEDESGIISFVSIVASTSSRIENNVAFARTASLVFQTI